MKSSACCWRWVRVGFTADWGLRAGECGTQRRMRSSTLNGCIQTICAGQAFASPPGPPCAPKTCAAVRDARDPVARMQPQTPMNGVQVRPDRRVAGPGRPCPAGSSAASARAASCPLRCWRQWPSLLASAALGVVVAVCVQSAPATVLGSAAAGRAPPHDRGDRQLPFTRAARPRPCATKRSALTPAAVALDERAQARWWPLRPELAAAARRHSRPGDLRARIVATARGPRPPRALTARAERGRPVGAQRLPAARFHRRRAIRRDFC
jgi:hypothetical protein